MQTATKACSEERCDSQFDNSGSRVANVNAGFERVVAEETRVRDSGSKCHERLTIVERVRVNLGFSFARV